MNEKLKNLNKKQFEKCLITLEMLTFATPKKYTGHIVYFVVPYVPKKVVSQLESFFTFYV